VDSKDFIKLSRRQAANIVSYINLEAPAMVVAKTLRFIDGNFRAQGWQGASFQPWQKQKIPRGQILIKTGRLRRGTNYTSSPGQVRFYNDVPYAKIHNEGGTINAVVNVRAFTRMRLGKKGKTSEVKAHTRMMKTLMPQRQFMPYEGHESPVLNDSIKTELEKEFKRILTF
jgi:phage gpG-like protein